MQKFIKHLKITHFFLIVFAVLIIGVYLIILNSQRINYLENVKAGGFENPKILIKNHRTYNNSFFLPFLSTEKPEIEIEIRDMDAGNAKISVYKTNLDTLFKQLVYDDKKNQINKAIDQKKLQLIAEFEKEVRKNEDNAVELPLKEDGVFYIKTELNDKIGSSFILRSSIATLSREGDNELIFWTQNIKTKKSLTSGTIKVFNLLNKQIEIASASLSNEGIAKVPILQNMDIALIESNQGYSILPLNLDKININYNSTYKNFTPKTKDAVYFIFSDRPIYKPGDTVYFKSVMRDDDDAVYSLPKGQITVRMSQWYSENNLIFEKKYALSDYGTIEGQYTLSNQAKTGEYCLTALVPDKKNSNNYYNSAENCFSVEYYRKPEYTLSINTLQNEYINGDTIQAQVQAYYFSGQPLAYQTVKYSIFSSDFSEYTYFAEGRDYSGKNWNGYYRGNRMVVENQQIELNEKGEGTIEVLAKISQESKKSQIFYIEASFVDETQNPVKSQKNVLVHQGEYSIFREQTKITSGFEVDQVAEIPLIIKKNRNSKIENLELKTEINLREWKQFQESNQKYPQYKEEINNISNVSIKTDQQGKTLLRFTPSQAGSYILNIEGKDSSQNIINKEFYLWFYEQGKGFYYEYKNDLTLQIDKGFYEPNETVKLTISSATPDRDIFLALERGKVRRFQIINLKGNMQTTEIPLQDTDLPNIFAHVASFSNEDLDSDTIQIPLVKDSKKIKIKITPDKALYKPGDEVEINILAEDQQGNPASSEIAFWAVDKAIFELIDPANNSIFEAFWRDRYHSTASAHSLEPIYNYESAEKGGCFSGDTLILMADKSLKPIEKIQPGEYVLSKKYDSNEFFKSQIKSVHSADVPGYLIINQTIRVTANHKLLINGFWQTAGSIKVGDSLLNSKNKIVPVFSLEWQAGKFKVYNLTTENPHNYFAGDILAHNEKSGGVRSVFEDTAYWNPRVLTDRSGRAKIKFKLPDNLTTWVLSAVGITLDTRAGDGQVDIVVNKDIVVRPVLPNLLREKDEIIVSALVQNFTKQEREFIVSLKIEGGEMKSEENQSFKITPDNTEQVFWEIIPGESDKEAKFTFSAIDKNNNDKKDIVIQKIPVKALGFWEKRSEFAEGEKEFAIQLSSSADKKKTKIKLTLFPSIIGSLPKAMEYLVDYPYGCIEQTTSRFAPAVVAKENMNLFSQVMQKKDLNAIIEKGIERLVELQNTDGGWSWWGSYNPAGSNYFVTSYVLEYLLRAKNLNFIVSDDVLKDVRRFFENPKENISLEDKIAQNYGLMILGLKPNAEEPEKLQSLSPDLLALAVITNYNHGILDPEKNGLNELIRKSKELDDKIYWEPGNSINYGSQEASTALAIQAVLKAKGDNGIAVKAARYLTQSRKKGYWKNTFATAQTINSLVKFSYSENEINPNYDYLVFLNEKIIAQGLIKKFNQAIPEISLDFNDIEKDKFQIIVKKQGQGKIYSLLSVEEFNNQSTELAQSNGLEIEKKYFLEINNASIDLSKNKKIPLSVGDLIKVELTLHNSQMDSQYAVITDELPAGLIPINPSLKNQNNNQIYRNSFYEIQENGVIIPIYYLSRETEVHNYYARVVSPGRFFIPPAYIELMYNPDLNGRTGTGEIEVVQKRPENIIEEYLKKLTPTFQPVQFQPVPANKKFNSLGFSITRARQFLKVFGLSIAGMIFLYFIFKKLNKK